MLKYISEARDAWNKRKKRVNYDDLFVIFDDIDDVEYDDLVDFNRICSKGKVIFTAKEYANLDNTVVLSEYADSGKMEHYMMYMNKFTGKCPADKDFNFVSWLNT